MKAIDSITDPIALSLVLIAAIVLVVVGVAFFQSNLACALNGQAVHGNVTIDGFAHYVCK